MGCGLVLLRATTQSTTVIKGLVVMVSVESLAHRVDVRGAGNFWGILEGEGDECSCELRRPARGHV